MLDRPIKPDSDRSLFSGFPRRLRTRPGAPDRLATASTVPLHLTILSLATGLLSALAGHHPAQAQERAATPQPALTAEECRLVLARNAAGAPSGADYVPGVSATGRTVAPADLPPDPGVSADAGTAGAAFDQVEIKLLGPIEAEGGTGVGAQLRPGTLTVNTRTGEVLLDGRPLTGGQDSNLARYCAALEKRDRR